LFLFILFPKGEQPSNGQRKAGVVHEGNASHVSGQVYGGDCSLQDAAGGEK